MIHERKYKLTKNGYSKRKTHPYIYELAKQYDDYGFMSNKLGKELNNLFEDGYSVAIHRTGYTTMGKKILDDVFNNGLINNGDAMLGSVNINWIDIEDTVTFFDRFLIMNGQIKVANKYKNSDGVFVIKVPTSYVNRTEEFAKPIYFMDGDIPRLLPEFIYGYIPVDKNGNCSDIIKNPNYKNEHSYKHNGLYYDSNTGISNNFIA